MDKKEFEIRLSSDTELVNSALLAHIPACSDGQDEVACAMRYSLENGGKRLRPILCLEFARACGADINDALDFACAIEFVHTYSLIHDDLPCMDNDDFRRGMPSCHKKFGEATALLAGDALLTHAFEIIASSPLSAQKKADAVLLLSQKAGAEGMIGGQVLDLKYESEDPDLKQILSVHRLKTGALIAASCLLGCIVAGADEDKLKAALNYAYRLGIAFQIKDDILDVVGDSAVLGKPVGSDAENDKTTYVTLTGLEKAQSDVAELTALAVEELKAFDNAEFLEMLAFKLIGRNK